MIYYRELNLDRASESRKNPRWIEQQWTRQQCRVFVLNDDKSLMRWSGDGLVTPEATHLPQSEVNDLVDALEQLVFLGFEIGRAHV